MYSKWFSGFLDQDKAVLLDSVSSHLEYCKDLPHWLFRVPHP